MTLPGSLATTSDQCTDQLPVPLRLGSICLPGDPFGASTSVPPRGYRTACLESARAPPCWPAPSGSRWRRSRSAGRSARRRARRRSGRRRSAAVDRRRRRGPSRRRRGGGCLGDAAADAAEVAAGAAATAGRLGPAAGGAARELPVSAKATAAMTAAITMAAVTVATPRGEERSVPRAPPRAARRRRGGRPGRGPVRRLGESAPAERTRPAEHGAPVRDGADFLAGGERDRVRPQAVGAPPASRRRSPPRPPAPRRATGRAAWPGAAPRLACRRRSRTARCAGERACGAGSSTGRPSPRAARPVRRIAGPARPTSSTARHVPSWSRARESSALAWLRETPSTVATSPGSRPWRSWSSMTSRSPGFSPAEASSSSARRSARSASGSGSTESSVTSGASSSADIPSWTGGSAAPRSAPRRTARDAAVGLAQPVEPGDGDDERVLHGVGGVGRVAEQGPAVLVEGICVPVVGSGQPEGIACHDGRDNLAVAHANTVAVFRVRVGREMRHYRYIYFGSVHPAIAARRPGARVSLAGRPSRPPLAGGPWPVPPPRAPARPGLQPAPGRFRPVSRPGLEPLPL